MKRIICGLFFVIIVCLSGSIAGAKNVGEFVPAKDAPWVDKGIPGDLVTIAYAKGDECFVLIQLGGDGFQDGAVIRTTEKPKNSKAEPVIQWTFFYKDVLGLPLHSYSYWGKDFEVESGPNIFPRCEKYLPELPANIQDNLRTYGAMK